MRALLVLPLVATAAAAAKTFADLFEGAATERHVRRAAERAVLHAMRRDTAVRDAVLHAARLGGFAASHS